MLNLFSGIDNFKEFQKNIESAQAFERQKVEKKELPPSYLKFYPIWQYDRIKFRKLFNEWLKTDEGKNRKYEDLERKQKEILESCYKRDKDGKKLRDCDESHIFRYQTLHKIYKELYNWTGASPLIKGKQEKDGLIIWREEYTRDKYLYRGEEFNGQNFIEYGACIKGCEDLTVYKRVIIHIRLLRLLRKGLSIKEALCQMKK